jgi:hypothetical protein
MRRAADCAKLAAGRGEEGMGRRYGVGEKVSAPGGRPNPDIVCGVVSAGACVRLAGKTHGDGRLGFSRVETFGITACRKSELQAQNEILRGQPDEQLHLESSICLCFESSHSTHYAHAASNVKRPSF